MTYRELRDYLNNNLTDEQLNQTATVSLDFSEESIAINYAIEVAEGDFLEGVLDTGHVVLVSF